MFQTIKNYFAKEQNYKIIFLSAAHGGRTCILYKLVLNQFLQFAVPTIGFNVELYTPDQSSPKTKFQIWDIAANCHIMKLWKHYYQQSNGIVYVIDLVGLKQYDFELKIQLETLKTVNDQLKAGIPMMIFFNRKDIYEKQHYQFSQKIKSEIISIIKNKRPYKITFTSAKAGEGLKEGMKDLLMLMRMKKIEQ